MQTHQLTRTHKNMKRVTVGRGGKRGKTSGRGGKGQSARAGNKRRPEWRDIIKKLPKLRGRGVNQNKPISTKPAVVNLGDLAGVFSTGENVTPTILVEKGVISTWSGRIPAVKILGGGELAIALKVSGCLVSESAKASIEKSGGSIELVKTAVEEKAVAPKKIAVEEPKKEPKTEKKTESKGGVKKESPAKKVSKAKKA